MEITSESRIGRILVPVFLILIAAILTVFAILSLKSYGPGYAKTEGTITDISITGYDSDGNANREVRVKFTVDGVEYEGIGSEYRSSFYIGKEISVRYEKSNPHHFSTTSPLMLILISSMAVVMYIVAAIVIIRNATAKKRNFKRKKSEAFNGFDVNKDVHSNDSNGFPY